jgi:hypothetical protein
MTHYRLIEPFSGAGSFIRGQRVSPYMFYVNEFADPLKYHDAESFEKLFGYQIAFDKTHL